MDTNKFSTLPETLTTDETRVLFREIMMAGTPKNIAEAIILIRALGEVADRHWHTYTLLDESIRSDLDEWVMRNWDRSSLQIVKLFMPIIAKLGLVRSFEMLRSEINLDISASVKSEIEGALREFGSSVNDPYSGMKSGADKKYLELRVNKNK